jgi:hypothetical protein
MKNKKIIFFLFVVGLLFWNACNGGNVASEKKEAEPLADSIVQLAANVAENVDIKLENVGRSN